jgi:hypothetical protein
MTRAEKNAQIAEALGFKRGTRTVNGRTHGIWIYPDKWKNFQCGYPSSRLPDFVGILEDATEFAQSNSMRFDYDTSKLPLREAG